MPSKPFSGEGSKFLVPRGTKSSTKDKEEHSKALVLHGAKNTEPHPTTSRALVLRKAAYGSGELAVSRKISGQEKLSLLAEEMMSSAIRGPFRLDELFKMAESQLGVHLDEISNLKDPQFFYDDIMATINSRIEALPDKRGVRNPPLNDTRWVALAVGCRIHNVYLLTGSWRIVRNVLKELEAMGLDDSDVRGQLKASQKMRARYLVLYDIITMLARMGQQRVANIAAATTHYAPYFVRRNKLGHDGEMEFDHQGNNPRKIREAHKSFIDAILLELVLPDSQYPPYVLMALLHNAVEECRKEEKRFSQALWDSVGDFSVTVQVLDFLEGPLLGAEGEAWIKNTSLSREYTEFLTVQELSNQACQKVDSWKSTLKSLIDTKKRFVLDQLWYNINRSCQQVSGVSTLDSLWSIQNDLERSPQWSTYIIPGLNMDEDSDPDRRALVLHKSKKGKHAGGPKRGPLPIGDFSGSDDDEMPSLMTVSDSSDDGGSISDTSEEEEQSEGDSESDYNPDEDELLQEMLQEALDAAIDLDLLEGPNLGPESEEKRSSNPFTRMLANLKDRYFSANPTLRANEQSRNPFKSRPGAPPPTTSRPTPKSTTKTVDKTRQGSDSDLPPLEPIRSSQAKPKTAQPRTTVRTAPASEEELPPLIPLGTSAPRKSQKTTIEEVEDEDDDIQSKKKKKKKKKKTKKPQEAAPSSPPQPPVQQHVPASPSPPTTSKVTKDSPVKQSPRQSSVKSSMNGLDVNFSQTSIPLTRETTAQSARAYMHSEHLTTEKTKVKTRPAFAGSFFKSDKENKKPMDGGDEKKSLLGRMKKIHLGKRAGDLMSRLISSADGKTHAKKPMKWEEFLKVMRAMGFSYDPSTAGSSVRFDPPDPKDPPITFHKPHPDPTLQRNHLRNFGKRLKKLYGWSPEQFNNFGVEEDEDSD